MAMFVVEQKQLKLFLRLSEVLFPAMMIMQSFRTVYRNEASGKTAVSDRARGGNDRADGRCGKHEIK